MSALKEANGELFCQNILHTSLKLSYVICSCGPVSLKLQHKFSWNRILPLKKIPGAGKSSTVQ